MILGTPRERGFASLALCLVMMACGPTVEPEEFLSANESDEADAGDAAAPPSTGRSSSGGSSSTSSSSASSSGSVSVGTEPSDPALNGIVAAHNLARSRVQPAAPSPIPPLEWSETDAAVARDYAARCNYAHNPNRGPRGENIYASSGLKNTPAQVVLAWESEKDDYNYAANSCAPGKACGHYTQVVWAQTTTVGCAVQSCSVNSPFGGGSWELWVCDYSPAGNFNGRRPY